MNIIEVNNVCKNFKSGSREKKVLDCVTFAVKPGEFVVLGGANGSGKTTLLNIILGLLKPQSGEVKLLGHSPQDPESKTRLGVMLQKVSVPKNMKVRELVDLLRSYYPTPLSSDEILNTVNLDGKHDAWASKLSGGEEQRLYFALALAGNPELLILDEPTRNLDKEGCSDFWGQIKACREKGIAILMVTNNKSDWEELQHLATRLVIICDGKISEDKTINDVYLGINTRKGFGLERSLGTNQLIVALFKQVGAEVLQLIRNPLYLGGIFVFSSLIALVPPDPQLGELSLLFFAGFTLMTFSIERLGKRIATERIEGWLNLLRVTPLTPALYLTAKVIVALFVLTVSLSLVFSLGAWRVGIEETPSEWVTMFLSLILGIIPFAILGLALGYLFKPKSVESISALSFPVALGTCGLPIPWPEWVNDLVTFSPFYHYAQLALWSARLEYYDGHILLHLIWLLWAGSMLSFLAVWAYKRDGLLS